MAQSGSGKKVVIVSPSHPTYADVRVFQKEARTLAESGYEVTLYAKSDGRQAPFVDSGVRVVPIRYSGRGGMVMKMPSLLRKLLAERADVYHLHNPFSLPLVVALKAARKTVVYDVHEDFKRRVFLREWIPGPLKSTAAFGIGVSENVAGKIVDAAIASQPDVVERLGPKTSLILNAPVVDGQLIREAESFAKMLSDEEVNPGGAKRLVYIGGVSESRGLVEMMDLTERVNKIMPARLWLLGYCSEQDIERAEARSSWQYTDYLGPQPQAEAFGRVARSDVALALLRNVGGHADASPNKIYEYMALGTPFVSSDFPFWRKGIPPNTGGLFVAETDPDVVEQAVLRLLENTVAAEEIAQRGQAYVRESFNWAQESQTLLDLYERLSP